MGPPASAARMRIVHLLAINSNACRAEQVASNTLGAVGVCMRRFAESARFMVTSKYVLVGSFPNK
jgi:hypothetical protein